MDIILRSIFNLFASNADKGNVTIIIDSRTGINPGEYIRHFRPISCRLDVAGVLIRSTPLEKGDLERFVTEECDSVIVLSDQEDLVSSVRQECEALSLKCIDCSYPSNSSRMSALLQEVAHHDYEIGGVNEWDGQPTIYPQYYLQLISQKHCRIHFPNYLLPYIKKIQKERGIETVECIDVGCGPISRLRWAAIQGLINITGVDPLLNIYQIILERHGLSNLTNINCHQALSVNAEGLSQYLPPDSFDVAYSCNAIDHTEDPLLVVKQIATCLRIGGVFGLQSFVREGTRQKWDHLHQFDIYFNSQDELVCQTKDGPAIPLINANSGFITKEIVGKSDTSFIVIFERIN